MMQAQANSGPAALLPTTQYHAAYVWLIASVAAMGGLLFG